MTSTPTSVLHLIQLKVAGHHPSSNRVYFVLVLAVYVAICRCGLADTVTLSNGNHFDGKVIAADIETALIDEGCSGKIVTYTWKKLAELKIDGTCGKPPNDIATGTPTNCSGKFDLMNCIIDDNVYYEKTCYRNINYRDGIVHLYGRDDKPSATEESGSFDTVHKTYTDDHGRKTSYKSKSGGLTIYLWCGK